MIEIYYASHRNVQVSETYHSAFIASINGGKCFAELKSQTNSKTYFGDQILLAVRCPN